MNFACSIGFSATADRMVWQVPLSRDRKWPHATKCKHSRPVGLRLKGDLVNDRNNKRASTASRQNVPLRHNICRLICLVMALTFDLWPWKHFRQCLLTWRIFVASFIAIRPLSTEISNHAKWVLTDGRTTTGKHNAFATIVGGGTKILLLLLHRVKKGTPTHSRHFVKF